MKIRVPDDMHVHLRDGDMLAGVAPATAAHFARAVVMPNAPSITSAAQLYKYRDLIRRATADSQFEPLMTVKMTAATTTQDVAEAHAAGAVAYKIYPAGKTTGSDDGLTVENLSTMGDVFSAMQELGLVLCVHGEHPGPKVFCLDRERLILPHILGLVAGFPRLRVVLEHITTADAVDWVSRAPDTVAATITVHHLYLTLNDVLGGGEINPAGKLCPDHYCAPVAKRPQDRNALIGAAMSTNPKFFLGTDSAPHTRANKVAELCCAGLYTAPVAVAALAHKFDQFGMLSYLEGFTSVNGARFYGLPLNEGILELERADWTVPAIDAASGVANFLAGHTLSWRVDGVRR